MNKINVFQKYINIPENKREKEVIARKESNVDRKAKFFLGLSMDELNNLQQAIEKRQEFVNQRILELKQQRAKKSENI